MSSEQKIQVLIDNKLYDLTKFAKTHPGGKQILENFNDCDATDYFYSIHSVQSRKMLKNMPCTEVAKEQQVPPSDYLSLLFKLEKTTNLFKADYFFEITQILHTVAFLFLATYYSTTYPLFAACCLGFGTLIAGWVGHQADHQRDNKMRSINDYYATLCAGLSPRWWSAKHNLHHLSTNEMDHDGDIQLMPFIYLWTPKKGDDSWNRGMQHIYFSALYSILQIKWQYDSVIYAFTNKYYKEFALLMVHWAWYACLPWKVWIVGTLIAGTISAWVVTASHQAETKLEGKKSMTGEEELVDSKYQIHDYFSHQVITTRNIDLHSWFLNYVCGGMQYQIEHHIFPRIPLYKLSTVKPMVKELCAQRGIDYNEEDFWAISKRNYKNIEEFAKVKV